MEKPKIPFNTYSTGDEAPPEEIEFFFIVGQLVFILQDTEAAIRACEQIVLGREIDVFKADKRTLGTLIGDLKTKASLAPDFQETMKAWVDNRNTLIHRADDQTWWHAETWSPRESGFAFLATLMDQTAHIKMTFEAVTIEYLRSLPGGRDVDPPDYLKKSGYLDALASYKGYSLHAIKRAPDDKGQ